MMIVETRASVDFVCLLDIKDFHDENVIQIHDLSTNYLPNQMIFW